MKTDVLANWSDTVSANADGQVYKHKVEVWEFDSFLGKKLDRTMYFITKEDAIQFVQSYNSYNDEPTTPDWYMVADYVGEVK